MKPAFFRYTSTRLQVALSVLFVAAVMELALSGAGFGNRARGADGKNMNGPTYQPDATVAEIMESIVMPSADILWNSVVIYATQDGLVEEKPETDEDWAKLRWSAVNLAEATNLLMMPGRRVDQPGVVSAAPDYELGPDQIQTLIDSNRPAWNAHAQVLHSTALQTIKIIDNKDSDGLSEIGGAIDEACESCHLQFWYPEQNQN